MLAGKIEFENVSFRYNAAADDDLAMRTSHNVRAGEVRIRLKTTKRCGDVSTFVLLFVVADR